MTSTFGYTLRDVSKCHGHPFQLEIPQLEISPGAVFGLLGPTGAGKSTLLQLLAGLEDVTSGEVCCGNSQRVSSHLPLATRRRITLVHQKPVLLRGSVRSNVVYGRKLRGYQDHSLVDALLQQFRLTEFAKQPAHTLSGGQTQLVALARALAIEPAVLLLDEPTAHLDPAHVALAEAAIHTYQQQHEVTIVWATHNLFQTRRVATQTALLLNGELIEIAPTETFFETPRDPRTVDFLQGRLVY